MEPEMTQPAASSRRSFLKGGALVAAPLAVAGASAAAAMTPNAESTRLQQLEDEAAIGKLHQTWLRQINAGAHRDAALLFADPRRAQFAEPVRAIATDHLGEQSIAVAPGGLSATGRFHSLVELESELPTSFTLGQMAHAQGGGLVRRTEKRILKAEYVKANGAWAIAGIELSEA
jgi:hypothetical protein